MGGFIHFLSNYINPTHKLLVLPLGFKQTGHQTTWMSPHLFCGLGYMLWKQQTCKLLLQRQNGGTREYVEKCACRHAEECVPSQQQALDQPPARRL